MAHYTKEDKERAAETLKGMGFVLRFGRIIGYVFAAVGAFLFAIYASIEFGIALAGVIGLIVAAFGLFVSKKVGECFGDFQERHKVVGGFYAFALAMVVVACAAIMMNRGVVPGSAVVTALAYLISFSFMTIYYINFYAALSTYAIRAARNAASEDDEDDADDAADDDDDEEDEDIIEVEAEIVDEYDDEDDADDAADDDEEEEAEDAE